jgi:hypothetical protein
MSKSLQLLKRIFSVRNLMCALFVVIAFVTAWAIFCVEERWRGERQWNNYRKEARQRGAKLEMKDVIPPDLPDAENFAATPLIRDLFAPRAKGQPAPKWFVAAKLGDIGAAKGTRYRGVPMLDSYRDEFVKQGIIPAPASDSTEAVLAALRIVEPELQQLREAGRRPNSKFPVQWERGIATLLPHLTAMQATTQVYRLGITANLAKGDTATALQHFRDGLRIYTAMRKEAAIISGLVRINILRIIESGVVEDGALSKWSDDDLRQIPALLAKVDIAADFALALESERALVNTIFDELMSKSSLELAKFSNDVDMSQRATAISLYPRGWFRLSQVKTNQFFDRTIAHGLDLTTKVDDDPLLRSGKVSLRTLPYFLYRKVTPAFENATAKYINLRAFHSQVMTACALELFRRKNSAYPERLDALIPEFLASAPRDPVDDSAMRYRRTDDGGFMLWSIGPNRIDDGGKSDPQKSLTSQLDWVLQVPGKP